MLNETGVSPLTALRSLPTSKQDNLAEVSQKTSFSFLGKQMYLAALFNASKIKAIHVYFNP